MRIREIFIVLVLIFSFLLPVSIVNAQTPEQRIEKLEQQVEKQDLLIDGYQKLLEESKNFREGVHQQVDSTFQNFNTSLTALSVLLGVVQLLFILFVGVNWIGVKRTINKMKKEAEIQFQKQKQEIQKDYEEKVNQMLKESELKLRGVINQNYKELLHQLINDDENIEAIEQIVQNELSYTSSRIGVISRSQQGIEKLQEKEIPLIEQSGIKKKISLLTFENNHKEIKEKIKEGELDVIIYYCEKLQAGEEKDQFLLDLVDLVTKSKRKISLITYTYQGRWLEDEEKAKANELIHTSANFPVTLLSHLLSLAYVFNRNTSQSRKTDGE